MIKVYCDRCGKDKTSYSDSGYHITVSYTQREDLCKRCMKKVEKLIEDFMEVQEDGN